jgi:ribosomal protein S18 acetylase RimI-like enzyme
MPDADLREVGIEDLDAILELTNACDIADTGQVDLERADVSASLTADGTRAWALAGADGKLRALTWLETTAFRPSQAAEFFVHPSLPPEVGTPLVTRLLDAMREDPVGRKLHVMVSANAPAKSALIRAHGATVVRHFFQMVISLADPTPSPTWRRDTELLAVTDVDDELRPVHATISTAFEDHWDHASQDFDAWLVRHRSRDDFDPSLWSIVRVAGAPAAAAICSARDSGGFVGAIGVLRGYRGTGLAKRLLLAKFEQFRERGFAEASLYVDSTNPTGAVRLYESVGMSVAAQWDCHEFPGRT